MDMEREYTPNRFWSAYIGLVKIFHNLKYEVQSNENRTPDTKWQWNLFYSKVIARSVNTFIPLGDETNNYSLVERGNLGGWWIHNFIHSCTFSSEWNRRPRMSFFRSSKMWKSQGERSGLYGGCSSVYPPNLLSLSLTRLAEWGRAVSCKRTIPSDSISGRFDFMARRSFCSVSA